MFNVLYLYGIIIGFDEVIFVVLVCIFLFMKFFDINMYVMNGKGFVEIIEILMVLGGRRIVLLGMVIEIMFLREKFVFMILV